MASITQKRLHVAVAALQDAWGRILISRRAEHSHQGGLWEFPGGKLERGEGFAEGLNRELWEELGIRVVSSEPLIRIHHDYADRQVLLDVHRVSHYSGKPHGREGQPLRWVYPQDLLPSEFPAADRPIINALRLPERMLVTGADPHRADEFLHKLEYALESGVRLVQLRASGLKLNQFVDLAVRAGACCAKHQARMLLNGPPGAWETLEGREEGRYGLHLRSQGLTALECRQAGQHVLVGASCHNRLELRRAAEMGLDYALLSPIKQTASHPEVRPLGWKYFSELVDGAALPVFALGGMGMQDIARAKACGGQGIAAIGALWDC